MSECVFFFKDTATSEIYTLSLHDALPIFKDDVQARSAEPLTENLLAVGEPLLRKHVDDVLDRKSTRLNSSHVKISYAVFCLKKKRRSTQPHLRVPTPHRALRGIRGLAAGV